jgi:hypothetical protein
MYLLDSVGVSEETYILMLTYIASIPITRFPLSQKNGPIMFDQHERTIGYVNQYTKTGIVMGITRNLENTRFNQKIMQRLCKHYQLFMQEQLPFDHHRFASAAIVYARGIDIDPGFLYGRRKGSRANRVVICTFGHPRTLVYHQGEGESREHIEVYMPSRSTIILFGNATRYASGTHFKSLPFGFNIKTVFYVLRFSHDSKDDELDDDVVDEEDDEGEY